MPERKKLIAELKMLLSKTKLKLQELEDLESTGRTLVLDLFKSQKILHVRGDRPNLKVIKGGKINSDESKE